MQKLDMKDGSIVYNLSKLDILNIVVAHIERGQGYLVGGGHYHAEVYLNKTSENENVLIEIRPTEEGLARIAKRKAAQDAGSATATSPQDKA